jgi:putative ABC transport system substrate-binding protein
MQRRNFITLLGAATVSWPFGALRPAKAETSKIYRLGTLIPGPPMVATEARAAVLIKALAQRGYVLGQNLIYEARGSAGKAEQLPRLMQELKDANVDVVVAVGYPAAVVAKVSGVATVLASGSGDPVATGLVESLARPGGNVTGIADDAATLSTKRLSLLKS